jgi:hypothetical protein
MQTATTYKAKGAHCFKTDPVFKQEKLNIDSTQGLIKNVAVSTAGEAKGHGYELDQDFITEVVRLGNEYPNGLKSRFGHPALSSEALGTYLGRFKNFRVEGNKALADLYLDEVAKKSPGGDLYTWVVEMAEKNPDQFGTSIVFKDDGFYQVIEGEKTPVEFDHQNGGYKLQDEDQPLFIAIKSLLGADIVDEPAANEAGLFSTKFNADKFAARVSSFLDENPDVWQFVEQHPEKFQVFFSKYQEYNNKKNSAMQTKKKKGFNYFFHSLAAALTGDHSFSVIDAKTTDGENIRIDAAGDAPGVGDAVYIVNTETDEQTPAGDGDYTISGGDYDAYKITVVDGKASAVFNPETPAVEIQQSSIPNYKALQKENGDLKTQLEEQAKKLAALSKEFSDFKKKPLEGHTITTVEEEADPGEKDSQYFANQPWNKRKKRVSAA